MAKTRREFTPEFKREAVMHDADGELPSSAASGIARGRIRELGGLTLRPGCSSQEGDISVCSLQSSHRG